MPTATTSQILGNCESFEPFQANVYKRSTMAGEFVVVNRHLMRDLMAAGAWSEDVRRQLLARDGSVQSLTVVDDDLKRVYRTVWEVPQRAVIDHAAARGPYVDQSQSMNLYMAAPSFQKLSSALVYAWKQGLKTGVYYLRSMAAVEAIKYGGASLVSTPSPSNDPPKKNDGAEAAPKACPMRRPGAAANEPCEMCSS
jgi:ribonucleotide reductase alpha subunit